MEELNSFKRLLEEDEQHYLEHHQVNAEHHLHSSVSMFRLIGDLFHLFVPHMADSAAMSVGAEEQASRERATDDLPPAAQAAPPTGPQGPGQPDVPGSR